MCFSAVFARFCWIFASQLSDSSPESLNRYSYYYLVIEHWSFTGTKLQKSSWWVFWCIDLNILVSFVPLACNNLMAMVLNLIILDLSSICRGRWTGVDSGFSKASVNSSELSCHIIKVITGSFISPQRCLTSFCGGFFRLQTLSQTSPSWKFVPANFGALSTIQDIAKNQCWEPDF